MELHHLALALAGVIGSGTSVIHGVLTQRLMVRPIASDAGLSSQMKQLVAALLQFSTYNWLLGGLALIAVAFWGDASARMAVGLLVGSSYLFGAVCNCWATRGRHPGWMLMAAAVALIAFGLF